MTLGYFSVPYYLLNYGEQYVASGLTALLFSSMPVFILIFSAIFLREAHLPVADPWYCDWLRQPVHDHQVSRAASGLHGLLGVLAILLAAIMHALSYVITKGKVLTSA